MTRTFFVICMLALAVAAKALPAGGSTRAEAIADDVMNRLWDQIDPHWHKGEFMHIVNLNTMAMAARPHKVEAYTNQAWLYWGMKRESDALAVYDDAMRKNPRSFFLIDDVAQYWLLHG